MRFRGRLQGEHRGKVTASCAVELVAVKGDEAIIRVKDQYFSAHHPQLECVSAGPFENQGDLHMEVGNSLDLEWTIDLEDLP